MPSIGSKTLSRARGRWYMIKRLTKYHIRAFSMRHGHYERKFRRISGRFPDYENPTTYGDKIAWMRLFDRNPLYTTLVDKIAVREYVRERVGEDLLVPRYGIWERAKDIDFGALPSSFVLKCNHESGFVILCRDKSKLDTEYARLQLDTRLKMNHYHRFLEWPYKSVRPRIVAEQLLLNQDGTAPTNYNIHCFSGKPGYVVAIDGKERAYHTPEWEHLDFSATQIPSVAVDRPAQLERMLEVATELSQGLRYCRVDLYAIGHRVYFGEITLFPGAGIFSLKPEDYNLHWGKRICLPSVEEADHRPT